MQIELRYFTGTGNSLKVLTVCREVFAAAGHQVRISELTGEEPTLPACDLLGFCFPVYAFGAPRIVRRILRELKGMTAGQKAFILLTAGSASESGFALTESVRILEKKKLDVVYSAVVEMPSNWITAPVPPFPLPPEEAAEIVRAGAAGARELAHDILLENRKYHRFTYPPSYTKLKFYWDFYAFRYLGIQNLWRMFKVYDSCNGCALCAKICPTGSIRIVGGRPVWSASCEQCMRCVNFCPEEAIYQSGGGDTKGKFRYREPDFKPVHRKLSQDPKKQGRDGN
ncbi:MAG: EFR1 family ferrodoxin [Bacteroidota bacterium]